MSKGERNTITLIRGRSFSGVELRPPTGMAKCLSPEAQQRALFRVITDGIRHSKMRSYGKKVDP